jgi:hypothetical protein
LAYEDDFSVRSDNPVFRAGFIELPNTCLFYPLTPKLFFIACSMLDNWDALQIKTIILATINSLKAVLIFIIFPKYDRVIAEEMYKNILSIYPQPSFSINILESEKSEDVFESILKIMNVTDSSGHPCRQPMELQPSYQT